MIDKKDKKKIEKVLKEFFKESTFEIDFEFGKIEESSADSPQGDTLKLDLKTDEPQVLIGPNGGTLHSFQMVLGKIIRKQLDKQIYLDIDINQYKQGKIKYLEGTAKEVADRVALNKKEEVLPTMSSYERRIIHMALAERGDISTESIGQGFERRVVVKPA